MCRLSPTRWVHLFVLLGLALRGYHYARCPSVWHDEAALIVNILHLSSGEMLGPLTHTQAAPPFFLGLERAAVLAFGDGEYALRLLPFLASCAALLLFAGTAPRVLGQHAAALAVGLFAVSDRLLWHATETKPYAVDVLVAAAAGWWFVRTRGRSVWTRCLPAAVAAPLAIWASYPACFVAGGLLVALTPAVVRREGGWPGLAAFAVLVGSVGASFAALAVGPAATQHAQALDEYWVGYFPNWEKAWGVPLWAAVSTFEVARYCLLPLGQVLAAFAVVGAVSWWRRGVSGQEQLAVFLLPLGLALVAAFLRKYPYGGTRLEVFAAPGVCLLVAEGARRVLPYLARRSRAVAGVAIVLLAVPFGNAAFRVAVAWPRADCRAGAEVVLDRYEPGDVVLHNHWEYEYYFRTVPNGWHLWPVEQPPRELDTAPRAWVVFTSRPLPDAVPLPAGWHTVQTWEFRETRVMLLERDAPPPG